MSRRVLRYDVPVDDQPHTLDLDGPIVHVATRRAADVELWVDSSGSATARTARTFLVVGTGHAVPDGAEYIGTAIVPAVALVWHLFEVQP